MKSWNVHTFGHVGKQVATLQKRLQIIEAMKEKGTDLGEIHATKLELNRWLGIEEEMWHQRSRNNWLKVGDRNTTFFHTKATNRHQRDTISKILDENNRCLEDVDEIGHTFVHYFEEFFTTSRPTVDKEMLDAVHPRVIARMNSTLT